MIGFSKGYQKRKFKYYPRYYKDAYQEKQSPFATNYLEKKMDQALSVESQETGRKFKFRRKLNASKNRTFIRNMRVNFLLISIAIAIGYAIHWVSTNTESLEEFWKQWGI